ncbi:MATE family efflux transporter [Ketobacter sp. MCCC 1A13808]|uniref:MATE family efflux transporter n=1 Tax=Ketobacter sp. MCCC 1A13808 TaxID=2602738 RepID=UPI000F2B44EC|nr:MATE family efflux transporter [Ketobacter sp. MCCC 1A13808]MVF13059.1 MATE family efflux transporter [Ketobacter sp. MCCC 1A13808]RLP53030.1 MAG: MATE family efflux transporter [Ketobacter sp.]
MPAAPAPTYAQITVLAIPIIIANSATPLLGLADTAVIGNLAGTAELGAVALGSLLFNFIYWGFGFLRMSTTGFVAQASGQNDPGEVIAVTSRALLLAVLIGAVLLILQWPLVTLGLSLLGASDEVEQITHSYFQIRIWGAPAILSLYVLMGYLIGQGLSRLLLIVQLFLNGINIALDILFAGYLHWGAEGIAAGTAIAEWLTLIVALTLVYRHYRLHFGIPLQNLSRSSLWNMSKIRSTLSANSNLMVRTLFLLLSFAVFADQGARFGNTTLAANHILLQFISFSAFFLDGFAFVTESLVGKAAGRRQQTAFDLAVKRSTLLAAVTAMGLAAGIAVTGHALIDRLTDIESIRTTAKAYLPFVVVYVLLSFAAFQLDGIFIGTTSTTALRNASVLATLGFLLLSSLLIPPMANQGLWIAFTGFVVLRALFLGCYMPSLRRQLALNDGP